jgi:hypothetical protein
MVRLRSGRFGGLLRAALVLALLLASRLAGARDGRVVVIDVDPRVVDALVVALSPWSLTVVRTAGPGPSVEFEAATARARVVAAEQHAGAVVWIAPPRPPNAQATLWVYDAETLQLTVRPLSVWVPFDEAGAASVALSVKTILRDSPLVAPEPVTAPPVAAPPAPPPTAPSPAREAPAASPAPAPLSLAWRFEALVGARGPTGAGAPLEPLASLGASVWPSAFGGRAGLGLSLQAGPGVSVNAPDFQGQLRGASLELTARVRGPTRRWYAFEAEVGPAVWLTSLDGRALASDTPLHAVRVDPSFDVGGVAELALATHVYMGLAASGAALLRFQRYMIDGRPLLAQPAWVGLFGLRLSVEIH